MNVMVTGASGLIGRKLVRELARAGHEVRALARTPSKLSDLPLKRVVGWNHDQSPDSEVWAGVDAIIHLAGENIAEGRWTARRKSQLIQSRVAGTRNLIRSLSAVQPELRPKVFVSASAIGYYGEGGERELDETSPPGQGFLATLCKDWEEAAMEAEALGLRVVILRTGVVLAREGGALQKMGPVILGDGKQWVSWIHLDDLIRFLISAIQEKRFRGVYNLTTPQPVRQRELIAASAHFRGFPFSIRAPAFALKLGLGELSSAILGSQRVYPRRAEACGFKFLHPRIDEALRSLYSSGEKA